MTSNPGLLWTLFFFALAIAPLIFVHELGHYYAGRLFGVKAEVFSIGFGRSVAGWVDRRGTHWKIGWLPLGGYVRFAGDMVEDDRAPKPALTPAERAQTFPAKPLWQRAIIVGAGPVVNLLVAVLLLGGIIGILGEPRTPPVVAGVVQGSAAMAAGLKSGDRIVAIDGMPVTRFEDIERTVRLHPGVPMTLTVDRGGSVMTVRATPTADILRDRFGNTMRRGLLGIASPTRVMTPVPFYRVPDAAIRYTGDALSMMGETIWQVASGQRSMRELGGPIRIAQTSGQQATLGVVSFVLLMAMLSINLGFINLLPIPMLDGGHLAFYAVEGVRGRPVPLSIQEKAYRAGFAMIIGFTLVVTVNDIGSLGVWQRLAGLIG